MSKRIFKPFIMLALVATLGVVVMLLWNAIIPSVIGLGSLSYLKAVGLLVLCRLLFGGVSGFKERAVVHANGINRHDMREKVKAMTKEERREYIKNYRHNSTKNE